jgi:hypothetical protein
VVTYFPGQGNIHPVTRQQRTAWIVCTRRNRATCAAVMYLATHPPRHPCLTSWTVPAAIAVAGTLRGRWIEAPGEPVCAPTGRYAAAMGIVIAAVKAATLVVGG